MGIIETWDGTATSCGVANGPDIFNVRVDGVLIFSETFDNTATCGVQTYSPPPGVELAKRVHLGFTAPPLSNGCCGPDSAYDMGLDPVFDNISHTASTLTIEWSTPPNFTGDGDESWAIDNVDVILNGVTGTPDTTPPVITLVGNNPQKIHVGSAYSELGATASDDIDGDISSSIVIDASAVLTSVPGSYTVTYTATDDAGNQALATRTVIIQSAAEASESLLDAVEDLSLPPKIESKLLDPLDRTITFLSDNKPNNDNGSCGQLNAFKAEVAKPKNDIDSTVQIELIAIAEAIQSNLGCTN